MDASLSDVPPQWVMMGSYHIALAPFSNSVSIFISKYVLQDSLYQMKSEAYN